MERHFDFVKMVPCLGFVCLQSLIQFFTLLIKTYGCSQFQFVQGGGLAHLFEILASKQLYTENSHWNEVSYTHCNVDHVTRIAESEDHSFNSWLRWLPNSSHNS